MNKTQSVNNTKEGGRGKKKRRGEEGGERHNENEDGDRDERREVINWQSSFSNLMARVRAFA